MLQDNRHIRAKKDGYFTKENLLKQLDHFQPHFTTSPTSNQQVGRNGWQCQGTAAQYKITDFNLFLHDITPGLGLEQGAFMIICCI